LKPAVSLTALLARPGVRIAAGILASALMSGLYVRGGAGWLLGFVALVPWLRSLDAQRTLAGSLLNAWAMSAAFSAAAFAWFGSAVGHYSQLGAATGLAVLLLGAPLFQPQFLAFALVRHLSQRRHGPVLCALAAAAAWVGIEWLIPKLLGDTLGYGLYPSRLLRQAADVGGGAGLTLLLLLANEAASQTLAHRSEGLRAIAKPLALAALVPALLAGYGLVALSAVSPSSPASKPLRMGLIQSNIVDYERLRQEKGADAVVREVLDTHYAMSYDAIERQHADAVLWSETVYPTTFGHPKSEAGGELDREILGIVQQAGVPFVFGTYDLDAAGEYNATAFVTPDRGLLGFYRKTRLFLFSEYVPAWLDGRMLRSLLPWTGAWKPGSGARVFPLRLADGREIPVLPLICLDDVDTGLAIDGARLGGQVILTMSNDAWFTQDELGAELHQTVAAFRSIETRLPQFRVTTNGYSAVIDTTGDVIAGAKMGERTLVVGELPVRDAPRTLMLLWGDWVGRAAAVFLMLLAVAAVWRRWWTPEAADALASANAAALPADVAVLPPAARLAAGLLRAFARAGLLGLAALIVLGDGVLHSNTLAQIRAFLALFLVPEVAAWLVLRAFAARATLEHGALMLTRGTRRVELALHDIVDVAPWHLPVPGPGVSLKLASGERHALAHADPVALARLLAQAGARAPAHPASRASMYAQVRGALRRSRLDHVLAKFVLLPLALAIPAFRLHQHIAYGGSFGEYDSFGLKAYLSGFALWWAAWIIATVLTASVLRVVIEAGTLATVFAHPARAGEARRWLERLALAVLYLGLPVFLLMRLLGH
jgi:apolipoprotein N-acyltransferase